MSALRRKSKMLSRYEILSKDTALVIADASEIAAGAYLARIS